jgi:hypothetical protein
MRRQIFHLVFFDKLFILSGHVRSDPRVMRLMGFSSPEKNIFHIRSTIKKVNLGWMTFPTWTHSTQYKLVRKITIDLIKFVFSHIDWEFNILHIWNPRPFISFPIKHLTAEQSLNLSFYLLRVCSAHTFFKEI